MEKKPKTPSCSGYCRPGKFIADAHAHATKALKRSRSADSILYVLVGLLLVAGLTHCTPARKAAAKRYRIERPNPAHGRFDWYMADDEA